MIPGSENLINQYGIIGLAAFLAADKLVYAFLRKKDKSERGIRVETFNAAATATTNAINAMSKAIVDLNKKFEGVDFRRMEIEIQWLKETHGATDKTGRLLWYDNSGQLKESLDDLKNQIGILTSAIRTLDGKIERVVSAR